MARHRLAPWCFIKCSDGKLGLLRVPGTPLFELAVSEQLATEILSDLPHFDWKRLYQATTNFASVLEIGTLKASLQSAQALLEEVAPDCWRYPKDVLTDPPPAQQEWQGMGRSMAIFPDKQNGYWLEVAGASDSLWSEDIRGLTQLLNPDLPDELKRYLLRAGFDGRGVVAGFASASTPQELLWWESTRFLSRLGPTAWESPRGISPALVPTGSALPCDETVARPHWPARSSVRGHEARALLTRRELVELLSPVFAQTRSFETDWYGRVDGQHGASGGGVWESEAWVWINQCADLAPGLYRFGGQDLTLSQYAVDAVVVNEWETQVKKTWGHATVPQALIAVVADLTRLSNKYTIFSFQLAHLNAGLRCGELITKADQMGLASRPLAGGVLKGLAHLLGLNPSSFAPICEVAVGGQAQ